VLHLIGLILQFYLIAFLVRIGLSWFPPPTGNFMIGVNRFLFAVTEPVLAPLRSVLPPVQLGSAAIDLSPTVVIIGLFIIIAFLG
jgi:YggT family protein